MQPNSEDNRVGSLLLASSSSSQDDIRQEEHESAMTFTVLMESFGDGSMLVHRVLPFLGSGHYIFLALVNRRMKYLYKQYLKSQERDAQAQTQAQSQGQPDNTEKHTTNGSNTFRFESLTRFYIREQGMDRYNKRLLCYVALHGNLDLLQTLHQEGYTLREAFLPEGQKDLCTCAASNGHLPVLQWARSRDCEWDPRTCAAAANGGHLETLQWAHRNGCPWDTTACSAAAGGGYLDILRWAVEHGCGWDCQTCEAAAGGGHLETLKWAREKGCEWDSQTCWAAAKGGHLETLQWARANGCAWDRRTTLNAARGGHLETLQWAISNGCDWDKYNCLDFASIYKHRNVIDWIVQGGG